MNIVLHESHQRPLSQPLMSPACSRPCSSTSRSHCWRSGSGSGSGGWSEGRCGTPMTCNVELQNPHTKIDNEPFHLNLFSLSSHGSSEGLWALGRFNRAPSYLRERKNIHSLSRLSNPLYSYLPLPRDYRCGE